MKENSFRHIKLSGPDNHINYTSPRSGSDNYNNPPRNRIQHGSRILQQLKQAWQDANNKFVAAFPERTGIYLEFIIG
ncbi:hypothetical protein SAMN05444380_1273 [Thermophagus xiamenensis]|uniref:Uncharacterized protein n=1 Tax=Thermophagus xiamenensis TaxID=385682 RepID=A0A1I2F7T5_9BACT|nr:hypothetical protein SAMN05444380_1273 [Thermophagus xiamenensis]